MGGGFHAFIGIKVDIGVNAEADISLRWDLMEMGWLDFIILDRVS
jgi:hypothetical protein